MKSVKKIPTRLIPPPAPTLRSDTPISASMPSDQRMKIVEMVMDDLERYSEIMSIQELCSCMGIISQASSLNYAEYFELVAKGRSIGFDYDPLNLVPIKSS